MKMDHSVQYCYYFGRFIINQRIKVISQVMYKRYMLIRFHGVQTWWSYDSDKIYVLWFLW